MVDVAATNVIEEFPLSIQKDDLLGLRLVARQSLTPRDVMLYALSVGLGSDPLDERQLSFVYEERLQAVPSMAITLCYPPALLESYIRAGIQPHRVLHGQQRFVLLRALPVSASLEGVTTITGIEDKGEGRGLLIHYETAISDLADGSQVASLESSSFCLDEGGAGSCGIFPTRDPKVTPKATPKATLNAIPATEPDLTWDCSTLPQAALLYRLSGDYNPLHASPTSARAAGYERPILHGRCTFGMAAHAILRACCDYDPTRLKEMSARFTGVVFPGETLRTDIWTGSDGLQFKVRVVERDRVVLDAGWARLRGHCGGLTSTH